LFNFELVTEHFHVTGRKKENAPKESESKASHALFMPLNHSGSIEGLILKTGELTRQSPHLINCCTSYPLSAVETHFN